jgi:hypothetical protein
MESAPVVRPDDQEKKVKGEKLGQYVDKCSKRKTVGQKGVMKRRVGDFREAKSKAKSDPCFLPGAGARTGWGVQNCLTSPAKTSVSRWFKQKALISQSGK